MTGLTWDVGPGGFALLVLVAGLAFGLALARGGRGRLLEAGLLAAVLLALVVAAAGPARVAEERHEVPARVAVLVDGSRSMGVVEDGRTRYEAARAVFDLLPDDVVVERYTFGGGLEPGAAAEPDAPDTDLGAALQALADRHAGERLAGIVVVTDGIDRGVLRRAWQQDGVLPLPRLPGPLTVVRAGRPGGVPDLAVRDLEAGGFAFLRTPFTVSALVEGRPWAGRSFEVELLRGERVVATRRVTLDAEGRAPVRFSVTPRREVGPFTYTVRVPVPAGDAVPGNNSQSTVVRVVRDRLRVLQVCGAPSFDQKFLRLFLKQDPSVDLVSFFILRTYEDSLAGYADEELSLIEFPYERLFSDDLWTFDVVVLQNFDYAPYFDYRSEELLGNIASYVRDEGGALAVIGGDRSFDLGEYAGTPLAGVLPVELGVAPPAVDLAPFQPRPTEQGMRHALTRLAPDPGENAELWRRLPAWDGLNLSQGLAPGAAALLVHPTLEDGGRPLPVLAIREVGRGRAMALMGDSSWRWVMSEAARGHGNQAYLRFWKNAFRWLVHDPSGEPVQVEPARARVLLGQEARLQVRVRDVGATPLPGARVVVRLKGPDGVVERAAVTDAEGRAEVRYRPERPGAWSVVARAEREGRLLGEGRTVFAVTSRDPELEEVSPDGAFLASLAAAADGVYLEAPDRGAPRIDRGAARTVVRRHRDPLWDGPLVPLLLGIAGSFAWTIRRRNGGR